MPKSLQLSALSGCLNSVVPKGLDNPMSIVLRLQPAPAWVYLVPTAAALGHSGDKGGARPPFPSSLNLPCVGRPATHNLLRHLQPQQHSLGRGAPCVSPGQVGPICSSICPYSFQLQEPYMPRQPTELGLGEYSDFTHPLPCAHGESTACDVFIV